jgi:phage regulator Rha-like protein
MTRDGFIMLVMGYTGPTAMQIKEAYIEAFNMMEWKLSQPVREREAKMMAYYEREAVRRERKANKVSDSEIMQMIELRNKRFTVREISAQLQRSFSTVRDHLRDARKNGLLDLAPGQGWLLPEVK